MKQPLLMIAGPTASGKTGVAVELAIRYKGEVVSADSMQIYRGMDIGTAKPTKEEMRGISHHLLDVVEPDENFSVADYAALARTSIEEIGKRGNLPILAGGTGLYLRAVTENLDFSEGHSDEVYREKLQKRAEKEGTEGIYSELKYIDPESAERIHPNDAKRLIRAMEVYHVTGITMTEHQRRAASKPSPYNTLKIGLWYEREKLYERINRRVDKMLEQGLEQEVSCLLNRMNGTSFQSIGYKELELYFQGRMSLEEAAEEIRQASRRYAKRQMTFFRADSNILWVDVTDLSTKEAADKIEALQEFKELTKRQEELL